MRTEVQYLLEILHEGVIQVAMDTLYLKPNGDLLTKERHRTTLTPGQFEEAEKILDTRRFEIVQAVWTDEIIKSYQLKQKEKEVE